MVGGELRKKNWIHFRRHDLSSCVDVKRATLRPATYTPECIVMLDTHYRPSTANEVVNENTRADRRSRDTLFSLLSLIILTTSLLQICRRRPYHAGPCCREAAKENDNDNKQ